MARSISRRAPACTVTYALAQAPYAPEAYKDSLADAERSAAERTAHRATGVEPARPGCCSGCSRRCIRSSPIRPTGSSSELPLDERVARLREPDVRAALLAEEPATENIIATALMTRWDSDLPARRPARLRARPVHQRGRRRGARRALPRGGRARLAARAGRQGAAVRAARQLRRLRPRSHPGDDHAPPHRARSLRRRRALRTDLRRQHADDASHALGARPLARRTALDRAGGAPADGTHGADATGSATAARWCRGCGPI